jgi:ferredoxin/flavodoxin
MALKKVYAVYFSPTGTTEKVVTAIVEGTGLCGERMDLKSLKARQVFKRSFARNDLVVAGLPVYGGRLPMNLGDFFSGLKGDDTPAVAMVMYGNREYEDALLELKIHLEERGFIVIAGAAFIGEHTFSQRIAPGRPNADDLAIAKEFGKRIIKEFDRASSRTLSVKGNYPFVAKGFDPAQPGPLSTFAVVITTEDCTQCGVCVEECPWGAIDPENYATESTKCLRCFRCIKCCPSLARKVIDNKFYEFLPQFEMRLNATRKEPELFLPQ